MEDSRELPDTEKLLQKAVGALLATDCSFNMCDGYDYEPVDMLTCYRCWVLHDIFTARPDLKKRFSA